MKSLIPQLAVLSSFLIPTAAHSQYAYSRLATFALTESGNIPTLPAKDSSGRAIPGAPPVFENSFSTSTSTTSTTVSEFGSRAASLKISNREILQQLVVEKVITSITGYSITEIYTDNTSVEGTDIARFYLTKRNSPPIDVSAFVRFVAHESGATSITGTGRTVETRNLNTNATTGSASTTITYRSLSSLSLDFNFGSFSAAGMNTFSHSLRIFGTGEGRYASLVPAAGRLTGLVGYGVFTNDDDPRTLEGTVSLAGGIPTQLPPATGQ